MGTANSNIIHITKNCRRYIEEIINTTIDSNYAKIPDRYIFIYESLGILEYQHICNLLETAGLDFSDIESAILQTKFIYKNFKNVPDFHADTIQFTDLVQYSNPIGIYPRGCGSILFFNLVCTVQQIIELSALYDTIRNILNDKYSRTILKEIYYFNDSHKTSLMGFKKDDVTFVVRLVVVNAVVTILLFIFAYFGISK